MIQDTIIETFLFSPTEELLDLIDDKALALRRLKELPDSAVKCYFLWQRDKKDSTRFNIVRVS